MRTFLRTVLFLSCAASLMAQTSSPSGNRFFDWKAVSATGAVAPSITLRASAPAFFTIDAVTTGTAPTTCTFEVESSPDGVNWNAGTSSLSGPLSCTAIGVLTTHFQGKAVRFLRVNLTALTGGDVTTSIQFFYTRGGSDGQ